MAYIFELWEALHHDSIRHGKRPQFKPTAASQDLTVAQATYLAQQEQLPAAWTAFAQPSQSSFRQHELPTAQRTHDAAYTTTIRTAFDLSPYVTPPHSPTAAGQFTFAASLLTAPEWAQSVAVPTVVPYRVLFPQHDLPLTHVPMHLLSPEGHATLMEFMNSFTRPKTHQHVLTHEQAKLVRVYLAFHERQAIRRRNSTAPRNRRSTPVQSTATTAPFALQQRSVPDPTQQGQLDTAMLIPKREPGNVPPTSAPSGVPCPDLPRNGDDCNATHDLHLVLYPNYPLQHTTLPV